MESAVLKSKIEAILFITSKAMQPIEIAELLGIEEEVAQEALLDLMFDYASREGALEIDDDGEVAILSQTTIARHQVDTVVEAARKRFPKLERPSRIGMCFATEERQEAVRAFAGNVDLVIGLGSRTSANSNRLVDVSSEAGLKAILVSDVEELDRFVKSGALQGLRKIGITAGASTPEDVIDGVIEYLSSFKAGQ